MSDDELKEMCLELDRIDMEISRALETVKRWASRKSPDAADLRETARYCYLAANAAEVVASCARADREKLP